MFGYVSADRAGGLVFLREWHVTPASVCVPVRATLPSNVLM